MAQGDCKIIHKAVFVDGSSLHFCVSSLEIVSQKHSNCPLSDLYYLASMYLPNSIINNLE